MMKDGRTEISEIVQYLRKNQTSAERYLWSKVRRKQINGKKIIRQFPVIFDYEGKKRFFVADFYCAERKLIIEVDGKVHEHQKEKDKYREYLLSELGFKTIRFSNEDVLNNIGVVLDKLKFHV